jgi:hypothetical protein
MKIQDIVEISSDHGQAAVVLEHELNNASLVGGYSPTQASIKVFKHISKAVLPTASKEQRALNIYGSYGSGKSHLSVVIAQLLRDGASTPCFEQFKNRLNNINENELSKELEHVFLPNEDADSRPYLLVSLYGSNASSIGAKLMEGLFESIQRHPELDIKKTLPDTEFDVCIKRCNEITKHSPERLYDDLTSLGIVNYLTIDELIFGLENHQQTALNDFLFWHEKVCFGASFNIAGEGGKNFIDAYYEAGINLSKNYNYGGIVVLWDEFGAALEDLIANPARNAGQEIMELQQFVEKVCEPNSGHTIFLGVTHVSFEEYGDRTSANDVVKEGLSKISGRFNTPFKIELNASEAEGYHLLGMQKSWTEKGKELKSVESVEKANLIRQCVNLHVFKELSEEMPLVVEEVYPLHPLMAAGLFNLSQLAQANRTALTFYRDNASEIINKDVTNSQLWGDELIRLPTLVEYYQDSLRKQAPSEWRRYELAASNVVNDTSENNKQRKEIINLIFLSQVLGESFKANENFLNCALYKNENNGLLEHLQWLKAAGLIWKNSVTDIWTLAGEGGIDIDAMIEDQIEHYDNKNLEGLLSQYTVMRDDLLPTLGRHNLEPASSGIVRSYDVEVLKSSFTASDIKNMSSTLSAKVYLVLAENEADAISIRHKVGSLSSQSSYFWIPLMGVESEVLIEKNETLTLKHLLVKYLAINRVLEQSNSLSEDLIRQFEAKWEYNRQSIMEILSSLYGRNGLQSGKTGIYKASDENKLPSLSWHNFKSYLQKDIQLPYKNEISIRAMNLNVLIDERYTGSSKIIKLVDRILKFDENPSYRSNDLLGEEKDTSESAALINGTLCANNMFIQRAEGWDLKKANELDEPIKLFVADLKKNFLKSNRNVPCRTFELRERYVKEPFGIPACTLPLFAAFALRNDIKRIRWSGTTDSNDSKILTKAFEGSNKIGFKLVDFTDNQLILLGIIGNEFGVESGGKISKVDVANDSAKKFREYIKGHHDNIKYSSELSAGVRDLVDFIESVGKSNQDLAEEILSLFEINKKLTVSDIEDVEGKIASIFNEFSKVTDLKKFQVNEVLKSVYPQQENKLKLIGKLKSLGNPTANRLASIFEESEDIDKVSMDYFTTTIISKSLNSCTDSDIGYLKGTVKQLVEQAENPPIKPISYPEKPFLVTIPGIEEPTSDNIKDIFKASLENVIETSNLTNTEKVDLIKDILDKLTGDV